MTLQIKKMLITQTQILQDLYNARAVAFTKNDFIKVATEKTRIDIVRTRIESLKQKEIYA